MTNAFAGYGFVTSQEVVAAQSIQADVTIYSDGTVEDMLGSLQYLASRPYFILGDGSIQWGYGPQGVETLDGQVIGAALTFNPLARSVRALYNAFTGLFSSNSSGLGDLTVSEVQQIQEVVNQAGRPLEVVGSAARSGRQTGSDIDYLVPHGSLDYYRGLEGRLPSIDRSMGIQPGVHNPYMGPAIRFEPNATPYFVP